MSSVSLLCPLSNSGLTQSIKRSSIESMESKVSFRYSINISIAQDTNHLDRVVSPSAIPFIARGE